MIIWSGMGKVVPFIGIVCMFLFVWLGMTVMGGNGGAAAGAVIAGIVAGLLVHLVAKGGEKQRAALIAAGQPVTDQNDPGSFFFIPTRTWAFLLPVAGIILAVLTVNQPPGA